MNNLYDAKGFKWTNIGNTWFKGYLFKDVVLKPVKDICSELDLAKTETDLNQFLQHTSGCFSIIIKNTAFTFASVDLIRSLPLYYSLKDNELIITDDPFKTFGQDKPINRQSYMELESAAYVCGNKTLFKDVFQLQAGEYLFYEKGMLQIASYLQPEIILDSHPAFETLKMHLAGTLEEVFARLKQTLGSRQAIVPLSGGYDSRLIALMLKKSGHQKILTFTYGRKDNFELDNSRKTAEILGLPWVFIDYNSDLIANYLDDETFTRYYQYAARASSMFYMQDYFAVKYLHDNKMIEKDAVFIPGHSGDFIAGSHLRESLGKGAEIKKLVKHIYTGTFNQNSHTRYKKEFLLQINEFIKTHYKKDKPWQVFELWDTMERQAKFIVNSTGVFDFFGYEFRLPYWDKALCDFFKSIPFEYKLYKKLYDKTLEELFFGLENLNFKNELKPTKYMVRKQLVKNKIKPYLPQKIKLKYLEKNDWMAYSIITRYMLEDMHKRGISYRFKADGYNAIISFWLLTNLESGH